MSEQRKRVTNSSAARNNNYNDKRTGSKKKKKKNKRRTLIIIDIVLVVVLLLILGSIFGVKAYIKDKLGNIQYETTPPEYTLPSDWTPPDDDNSLNLDDPTDDSSDVTDDSSEGGESTSDNISSVLEHLTNLEDARAFYNSGEMAEASYVTNILFIGTDLRINQPGNGNSDSMILVSINNKTKKIILTSIMRDLYVYIPAPVDSCNKLNYAHATNGGGFLCKTISGDFKIKVDKYVRVDFFGLIDIIDKIGGVDLEITEKEIPYANAYIYEMIQQDHSLSWDDNVFTTPGMQHMSGLRAVAYARIRGVGSDFERTNRQRKILITMFNKLKTLSLPEIDSFIDEALSNVATNMTQDEIYGMVTDALKYLSYEVVTQRIPYSGTYAGEKYVLFEGKAASDVITLDLKTNIQLMLDMIYGE